MFYIFFIFIILLSHTFRYLQDHQGNNSGSEMNYGAGKSKFYAASDSDSHASVSKLPATNHKKDATLYLSRLDTFHLLDNCTKKMVSFVKMKKVLIEFTLIKRFSRSTFYNDQVLTEESKTDLRDNIDSVSYFYFYDLEMNYFISNKS